MSSGVSISCCNPHRCADQDILGRDVIGLVGLADGVQGIDGDRHHVQPRGQHLDEMTGLADSSRGYGAEVIGFVDALQRITEPPLGGWDNGGQAVPDLEMDGVLAVGHPHVNMGGVTIKLQVPRLAGRHVVRHIEFEDERVVVVVRFGDGVIVVDAQLVAMVVAAVVLDPLHEFPMPVNPCVVGGKVGDRAG